MLENKNIVICQMSPFINNVDDLESFSESKALPNLDSEILGKMYVNEIENFDPIPYLGKRGHRYYSEGAKYLLISIKNLLKEFPDFIPEEIGMVTSSKFNCVEEWFTLSENVEEEGYLGVSPMSSFAFTLNQTSNISSVETKIKGYNTSLSTSYAGGFEALEYALFSILEKNVRYACPAAVEFLGPKTRSFEQQKSSLQKGSSNTYCEGAVSFLLCEEKDVPDGMNTIVSLKNYKSGTFPYDPIDHLEGAVEFLNKEINSFLKENALAWENIACVAGFKNGSALDEIQTRIVTENLFSEDQVVNIKNRVGEGFSLSGLLQITDVTVQLKKGEIGLVLHIDLDGKFSFVLLRKAL